MDAAVLAQAYRAIVPAENPAYATIPFGERDELLGIRQQIADALSGKPVDWQTPETYHITLAYAENISGDALASAYVSVPRRFSVRVSGLSLFNNPDSRALVLVVDHSPDLDNLQFEVYERMEDAGAPMSAHSVPERWQPHITIAFLPGGVDMPQIAFDPFELGVDAVQYSRDDYQVVKELAMKSAANYTPFADVIRALGYPPAVRASKSAPQTLVPDVYNLMLADMTEAERAAFEQTYARVFASTGDAVKAMLAGQGAVNRLYKGLAVKAARKADQSVIVAGWGVLFGDPQHRDVDKTWFGPNTQYFLEDYQSAPLWLQHGQDAQIGSLKAGNRVHAELFPEVGVWAEHIISPEMPAFEAADFDQTVADIENGLYTYSSDSILHHVQNGYHAESGELTIWPLAGWSLIKPDRARGLPPAAEPGLGPVVIKRQEAA